MPILMKKDFVFLLVQSVWKKQTKGKNLDSAKSLPFQTHSECHPYSDDAKAVVEQLKKWRIPFKVCCEIALFTKRTLGKGDTRTRGCQKGIKKLLILFLFTS